MYQTNQNKTLRSALLLGAASAAALSFATAAMAQETTNSSVETVVVTGSRIPETNLTSPSPLAVATAEQISMTKAFNLEDVIEKLIGPDATTTTANNNNGGAGTSSVGLRDLGASRTLVLIDGQRLVPFAAVVDLNSIPIAMIDHVEVLKDGASSVYGADAIGGVVNIITKKDFNGLQFDMSGGLSEHGGGENYSLNGIVGVNTDKGNVTIAITNEKSDPVGQWQRDWAEAVVPGASTYRTQLDILQNENNTDQVWYEGTQYSRSADAAFLAANVPCITEAYANSHPSSTPTYIAKLNAGCHSPDGGWNDLTGGVARTQISANAHYDITPDVTFVAQGFFTDRTSRQQLRPEPLLGDTIANGVYQGFIIPSDWPGNTTGSNLTAYLTPLQFGPREYRQTSETYRIRAGFEGKIFGDFNWEAGYVTQRANSDDAIPNSGNFYHLEEETGQTPCVDAPGGCTTVPDPVTGFSAPIDKINFFNGPNIFTPEQLAYLEFTSHETIVSREDYGYADINGPLFDLPYGTVKGAFGVERRFEHLSDSPDTLIADGYGANAFSPTDGGYSVSSAYAEFKIPVLNGLPFAQDLTLTASGRYDEYSTFGSAKTWKLGGNWQVDDNIRFRGTWETGFRAPNADELFGGQGLSDLGASGDPCDTRAAGYNGNSNVGNGILTAGSTCALALAGKSGATFTAGNLTNFQDVLDNQSASQIQVTVGGNPFLKPEQSRQWSAGTVITPTFFPGFSFAADYYEVNVTNAILDGGVVGASGADFVLNGCYGPSQNTAYCALIKRDPAGNIIGLNSTNGNFGLNRVTGLDLETDYNTDQGGITLPFPGSINLNAKATEIFVNKVQNTDGTFTSYEGAFTTDAEEIQPRWKGTASVDYNIDAWSFHYDTQFIEHMKNYNKATGYGNVIPDYWYHNFSVAYDLGDIMGSNLLAKNSRVIFGVNNAFDKDPPFLTGDTVCKCNSIAGPYDFIGRFYFLRFTTTY